MCADSKLDGAVVRRTRQGLRAQIVRGCIFSLLMIFQQCACNLPLRAQGKLLESYHHTLWNSGDGLGTVKNVQQASDGYVWLTTSRGVFRFDGVRFQSVDEATNGAASNRDLDSVFVAPSGNIWFTTRAAGMLLWKNSTLTTYPDRRCTPSLQTDGVVEDQDGSLWLQARTGLAHLHGTTCDLIGKEQGYPGGFAAAITMDHRGTLWVETKSGGLLYLPPHETTLRRANYDTRPTVTFVFMHEAPDGSIWLADETGLRRVTEKGGRPGLMRVNAKPISSRTEFGNFTFTSDGTLWAGTPRGLSRFVDLDGWPSYEPLDENNAESFTTKQGLSSDGIWSVLVDRESNIWVGSNGGLDQLRRSPLTALTLPPAQEAQIGVASGDSGSLWIGSRTMPLTHVTADGKFTAFPHIRLLTSVRRDRKGTIWAGGRGEARLWRLVGDHFEVVHYPGEYEAGVSSLALDRNGELWLLIFGGATYHLRQGVWSNEAATLGRKPGVLGAMTGDGSGNVWIAFSNKLVRWNGTTYDRFSFPEGTLNISVRTLFVRDDRVWIGGEGGVVLFHQGQFHLMHWKSPDLPGRVTGIVETESGDLWMNGYSGVSHVPTGELSRWLGDFSYPVSGDHLDALDGLPGLAGDRTPEPSLIESQEGRLLFATTKSVAWLDPTMLRRLRNRIVPPVEIVSVAANGRVYRNTKGLRLPARTENLEIDFTALSLAMPERVFFRYKMDGVDQSWQDSGTRRQAFYTKLPPGQYRFQVTARNNDGVWNETGAILDFSITPAFYQTLWFRSLCVAAFLALLVELYRLRLRQVAKQFNMRLEERVSERTRIARELHDTLLQSFQGVLLKFHAVMYMFPDRPVEAQKTLETVIEQARQAITEGRDAVQGLRSSTLVSSDIAQAISTFGEELAAGHNEQDSPNFRVLVEGAPRDLAPFMRDEIYRITGEALRNAFRHAQALRIEVEIRYDQRQFRLRVRDNGKGIDPAVLNGRGRPGHYGLPGMDERAKQCGGKLAIWSELNSGTEAELSIPATIAYAKSSVVRRRMFWGRSA
jgi:signal transduction histidine kinase/ligand-binding sensor domain-containing protein